MKMYRLLLFCGIALMYACSSSPKSPVVQPELAASEPSPLLEPKDLIHKTIEYTYGESVYHVTIDSDSTLHWEAMAGDEKGVKENEHYIIESIHDHMMFITWGEANGIGVSQVLNFKEGVVHNHLLRGRDVSNGQGIIKILD